jgi:hypothetical protein
MEMPALNIVTCRAIARDRVGKYVSMEMHSWKPTRCWATFPSIGDCNVFSLSVRSDVIQGNTGRPESESESESDSESEFGES